MSGTNIVKLTQECRTLQRNSAEELRQIAEELREQQKTINITKVTSSSVGAGAGIVSVGALILAPFTLGATLPVAVGAGAVGLAAAGVDIGAAVAESKVIRNRMEEAQKILDDLESRTEDLLEKLSGDISKAEIQAYLKGGAMPFKAGAVAGNLVKALKVAKVTSLAQRIAATLGGGRLVVAGARAVSKVAKVGGPILGAVGVGFSIYEIVDSSIKIHGNVSKGADVIEQIADALLESD